MSFRESHPEVLALGFRWKPENFERIYSQEHKDDRQWALYYTYVELTLGFCNAVAYASRRGLLDRSGYENHYRSLMRLLLTEHQPIISGMVRSKRYVSTFVQDFWSGAEADGWQWEAEHLALRSELPPNIALPRAQNSR